MKSFKVFLRLPSLTLALIFFLCIFAGCNGKQTGKDTPETNPLYQYDEVVEFNKNSVIPMILGTKLSEISGGYELRSGTSGHFESYLSKENLFVSYYFGRHTLDEQGELYATAVRIRPESRSVEKDSAGNRTTVFVSSNPVMGVKLGESAESAGKKLEAFGYECIYKEVNTTTLPKSLEHTYIKGVIVISLAIESNSDQVSSIYAWIPYDTADITQAQSDCVLPAELGSVYNVLGNESFSYKEKDQYNRVYATSTGTTCVLRGYPDSSDMIMNAEVSFTAGNYNISGAMCGMTISNAVEKLLAAGWVRQGESLVFTRGILTAKIFTNPSAGYKDEPSASDEGSIVAMLRLCLPQSTSLDRVQDADGE